MTETPHILIVEDQANTAEMLTSYFEAQGYEVTAVGWGKDALAFIENRTPDLVMLDIRLPDIDGYEVYQHLRGRRRTEHVPVIFLTERRKRMDKLTGLGLGAADYVTKPFDVQELRLRVRNVLHRSKLGQLSHPITSLPSPLLVEERLEELLGSADWVILSVSVQGLNEFAETYGFVARDDVVRAVALMLGHVVDEHQALETFLGHLDDTSFCVVLPSNARDRMEEVQGTLETRLGEAMAFFYPRADWEARQEEADTAVPGLEVRMGILEARADSYRSVTDLKKAIVRSQRLCGEGTK